MAPVVNRQRVLHRDLKPSNILVTESGWPKLLDFGIARLLDAEGTGRETASGVWLFTLDYAAPEQILGRRPGPAADPALRYASVGAFAEELAIWLAERGAASG